MLEYAFEGTSRMLLASNSTLDDDQFNTWIEHVMADDERRDIIWKLVRSLSPSLSRYTGTMNDLTYDALIGQMPLTGITAPTLIIHGTNDGDVSPDDAVYASETIVGSELYWVDRGTHLLMLSDDANEMTNRILSFLNEHVPQ